MDRALWQRHLEQAERDVAVGQRHIMRQKEIIVELKRRGIDSGQACDLLAQFKSLRALHIAHRDRLREELGDEAPPLADV
jgi:hypothetical protein